MKTRFEILVIVFQKYRDVLVLQSYMVCVCQAVLNYRFGVLIKCESGTPQECVGRSRYVLHTVRYKYNNVREVLLGTL